MTAALETRALGKRFRRGWAVRDCARDPRAGDRRARGTELARESRRCSHWPSHSLRPTEGEIGVLGRAGTRPGSLGEIGYVAQDAPLYRSFTVGETLDFARRTNDRWDRKPRYGAARPPVLGQPRLGPLGRRASTARPRRRAGKAPPPAPARRAVRSPRSPRGARVPPDADGRRYADRGHGRDRLPRRRGPRAGCRPHRPVERRAGAARGQRRGAARPPTGC